MIDTSLNSFDLSSEEFTRISNLVQDNSGIVLNKGKHSMVKSRLAKRVRAINLASFSSYIDHVLSISGRDELDELICAISTNVTGFNREPHHFTHFNSTVLPKLVEKLQKGEPIRVWSAGCSNGSEPHTLACAILDAFPAALNHDLRILGTDIDKYSLETARSGEYSQEMISKLSDAALQKWFVNQDGKYQLKKEAKSLVTFKYLNLMTPWPLTMNYDVIFCRNVLIYFNQEDQTRLFSQFANQLKLGAHLYIGHSERVMGPALKQLSSIGSTTYTREV